MQHLVERARGLIAPDRRTLLGITGAPGSGKSTLARLPETEINRRGEPERPRCRVVPMDGFHLSDAALSALGRLGRKGAIDTFDGWGYRSVLERVRTEPEHIVFTPAFERDLEQPIAAGTMVEPSVELVIAEGNYLLMDTPPWPLVRELLDEVWFCELDRAVRVDRLVARHIEFGKTPGEARAWVERVDEANARDIQATVGRADLVIDLAG